MVVEPTTEQCHLLEAIWNAFCSEKTWPTYIGVNKKLNEKGLDVRQLIETMPSGLMIPDAQARPFVWTPQGNDQLRVTLVGLSYCPSAHAGLNLLARVARYFADREKAFDIGSLSAPAELVITSTETQRMLGLTDEEAQLVCGMITSFHVGTRGSSVSRGQWACTIDIEDVRRYRAVENADDFLAAFRTRSATSQPIPPGPRQELGRHLRAGLRLGQRVLEHKIVSGVVVAVVAALIAAALITWLGLK